MYVMTHCRVLHLEFYPRFICLTAQLSYICVCLSLATSKALFTFLVGYVGHLLTLKYLFCEYFTLELDTGTAQCFLTSAETLHLPVLGHSLPRGPVACHLQQKGNRSAFYSQHLPFWTSCRQ
jgi:hypothetical protein